MEDQILNISKSDSEQMKYFNQVISYEILNYFDIEEVIDRLIKLDFIELNEKDGLYFILKGVNYNKAPKELKEKLESGVANV